MKLGVRIVLGCSQFRPRWGFRKEAQERHPAGLLRRISVTKRVARSSTVGHARGITVKPLTREMDLTF
jgi:hypothetical protein